MKASGHRSLLAVAGSLAAISIALYLTPDALLHWHYILQRLFYFPIIVAGLNRGWKAGAITATLASILYLARQDNLDPFDMVDRWLEAVMFCLIGVLTGVLSERELRQRTDLRRTAKRLEEVYLELQANVEQLNRAARMSALGHLSAGLAHEIRNPLAGIDGAAYVAQTETDPAQTAEFLGIIRKETKRLNELVTHFLEFAKPRPPEVQGTDIRDLTSSVLKLVSQLASQHRVEISTDFPDDLGPVECDPEQLKQVLLNLLINSLQAMPKGGRVLVSAKPTGNSVTVRIEDTGPGIETTHAEQIFDPFFTTKQDGTGLGLPIAYRIIQQHGGELTLEKNSPAGCCFSLRVPYRQRTEI